MPRRSNATRCASHRDEFTRAIGCALLLGVSVACSGGASNPGEVIPPPAATRPAKWALQWADEFDGTTIDPSVWVIVDGAANVNNEREYYTPSDAYIEGGSLVLRSQQRNMGGRGYTSAEVRTGPNRLVGRGWAIEWRTQIPSGKGIWPANWLVASRCDGINGCGSNWPPEIDVLEVRGSLPNVNVMTHWWGAWPNQNHQTSEYANDADLSLAYHTYRVEWFRDSVVWYMDGVARANHTQNIPFGPVQLVMNTAIGGDFDGAPDVTTVFPKYHRIDYVRTYRDTANAY